MLAHADRAVARWRVRCGGCGLCPRLSTCGRAQGGRVRAVRPTVLARAPKARPNKCCSQRLGRWYALDEGAPATSSNPTGLPLQHPWTRQGLPHPRSHCVGAELALEEHAKVHGSRSVMFHSSFVIRLRLAECGRFRNPRSRAGHGCPVWSETPRTHRFSVWIFALARDFYALVTLCGQCGSLSSFVRHSSRVSLVSAASQNCSRSSLFIDSTPLRVRSLSSSSIAQFALSPS